ncbi:unnamed protein product [Colias eurytheme]|nr:unnamed protein product [Colias eurytheme]
MLKGFVRAARIVSLPESYEEKKMFNAFHETIRSNLKTIGRHCVTISLHVIGQLSIRESGECGLCGSGAIVSPVLRDERRIPESRRTGSRAVDPAAHRSPLRPEPQILQVIHLAAR